MAAKKSKKAQTKSKPKKAAPKKTAPKKTAPKKVTRKRVDPGAIHQTISFGAPPDVIWSALLDGELHTEFTGAEANVEARVGAKFNAWDGYIHGVVMELVPTSHIVKSWRAADFPQAHPSSRLQIDLAPTSDGGTTLELRHTGLPPKMTPDFALGWHEHYWGPLRAWLAKRA